MRLVGIGMDLVEVARIKKTLDQHGERFLKRIFTEAERAYCLGMKRPEAHLAARFAAKEAISKCFGTGITGELGWLDMEILKKPGGAPYAVLSEKALALAATLSADTVLVSLTHTEHYAAANAALVAALPPA